MRAVSTAPLPAVLQRFGVSVLRALAVCAPPTLPILSTFVHMLVLTMCCGIERLLHAAARPIAVIAGRPKAFIFGSPAVQVTALMHHGCKAAASMRFLMMARSSGRQLYPVPRRLWTKLRVPLPPLKSLGACCSVCLVSGSGLGFGLVARDGGAVRHNVGWCIMNKLVPRRAWRGFECITCI